MSDSYSAPVSEPYEDDPVVLLSIDEEWAEAILTAEKRYEYRRSPPTIDAPFRTLLYATAPTQAIVGAVWVNEVIEGPVDGLAENTAGLTPHDPEDVRDYFDGKDTGTALGIMGFIRYDEPVMLDELRDVDPDLRAPQNFRYLRPDEDAGVLELLPYKRGIPYER